MPRVRPGHATRKRHKRMLRRARGFTGARSKLFKTAKQAVIKSLQYATRDRRMRKREFRALWITRITAACRMRDVSYSHFMGGLGKAGVFLNRKMLSEVAIHDPQAFDKLVDVAKQHQGSAVGAA